MSHVPHQSYLSRAAIFTAGCTFVLATSFAGIVALVTGPVGSTGSRLPAYVLIGAITFVVAILLLEESKYNSHQVLVTSVITAIACFILVSLSIEGLVYAFTYPDQLLASQLALYFLSAGLVATGLTYWGINNWRDVTRWSRSGL